jgi:uncharacterized protein (TIGR02646 family)
MVELQHLLPPPVALAQFCALNPNATPDDFDSLAFRPVKTAVKVALHQEQGGLCVYCEQTLAATDGQVEHIKPKGGPNGQPALCFTYTNHAYSCINPKTCGQKKQSGLLPIEPGPGCNSEWTLSTDGTVEPIAGLTRARNHAVRQTRDMLGLNADANLVIERERWLKQVLNILQQAPNDIQIFLQQAPYRHILATVL